MGTNTLSVWESFFNDTKKDVAVVERDAFRSLVPADTCVNTDPTSLLIGYVVAVPYYDSKHIILMRLRQGLRVRCPNNYCGHIIGKKGRNLKRIEQLLNMRTKITVAPIPF